MAYDYRAEGTDPNANPNHPDLVDPYRELRKLVRTMKPEEEKQRPFDFGNVRQSQLAVDGYASRIQATLDGSYEGNGRNSAKKPTLTIKHPKSQATRPDGWQKNPKGY